MYVLAVFLNRVNLIVIFNEYKMIVANMINILGIIL